MLVAQVLHYQTFITYTNDLRYQVIGDISISFIPLESIANEHFTLFDRSRNTKVIEFIFVANRVRPHAASSPMSLKISITAPWITRLFGSTHWLHPCFWPNISFFCTNGLKSSNSLCKFEPSICMSR